MEYNRDESVRCIQIATDCLAKGDKEKALKFAKKSEKLYPSSQVKDLFEKINRLGGVPSPESRDADGPTDSSRRRHDNSQHKGLPKYTGEQVSAVNRIKRCKDYYEILGLERNSNEKEVKKKYRKLALQFHPDKNHAPGAIEAFKAIGNAFSVLSDPEKRKKYDLLGADVVNNSQHNHSPQQDWNYSHGFESDRTAEEIFNMFFGGGEFTNASSRSHSNSGTAHTFRRHHHMNSQNWSQMFLQLSPIFVLVLISIVSMAFVGDEPYSFAQTPKYTHKRISENLQVVYFVMKDFSEKFPHNGAKRIDREVESFYVSNLRRECIKEKSQRENLKWRAYRGGDKNALGALNMEMRHCKRLEELYSG